MKTAVCLALVIVASSLLAWGKIVVGEDIQITLESGHPYGTVDRAVSALVWSESLHDSRATYIAPHFAQFELAKGDWVIVRSPDGSQSWRYEGLGRGGLGLTPGGFWSTHIKGDTAIVELYSQHSSGSFGFVIDRFARGYTQSEIEAMNPSLDPGPDPDSPEPEAICGIDDSEWAKCYAISEPQIYDKSRAVARLLINGSSFCTGWLIGCDGHLMTNNHCIGTASAAANTDFEFMAEGATCQTSCLGGGACAGTIGATTSTFIQTDSGLDFTLVKLPTNLSQTYGYMQLRDSGPVVNERIYVPGHPAAWGKRIAVFSTHANDESGFCEIFGLNHPACTGGPGDVGYYADTQGGSSGSPVLAYSDHRVVSLHHCANCANRGTDVVDIIANLGANLPPCAVDQLAGTIELDRAAFNCSDSISITVLDDSLQGAGSQPVSVWSETEPVSETAILVEGDSGTFFGAIATTAGAPTSNGMVSVGHGDLLTAQYVDADDGAGGTNVSRVATAVIDCAPPVISAIAASGETGNGATISWSTNEPADSVVVLGGGALTVSDSDLVGTHALEIVGIPECTMNYYSVSSTDEAGNTATDDAGGDLHSFATGANNGSSFDSVDTPRSIPTNSPPGVTSNLSIFDDETVADVNVRVDIDHDATGELTLYLKLPNGSRVLLAKKRGGTGNDFINTVFDDEASVQIGAGAPPYSGSFRPEQPLSAADGINAAGNWGLLAVNDVGGTSGTINSWELTLTYPDEPCPPPELAPPPIPDGSGATDPLTIERSGSDALLVQWDEQCAPLQTNLLYGPLDQVSSYTVAGALCGVTSGVVWSSVPPGDLWILLVAEDGQSTEGSWGQATSGERNGTNASGQCGNDLKDATGICP